MRADVAEPLDRHFDRTAFGATPLTLRGAGARLATPLAYRRDAFAGASLFCQPPSSAPSALGLESHQVVRGDNSRDRVPATDAGVRPMPIVMVQPGQRYSIGGRPKSLDEPMEAVRFECKEQK